jgi:Calcineurin-like phosphoesterase
MSGARMAPSFRQKLRPALTSLALLGAAFFSQAIGHAAGSAGDPVIFTFCTTGDSRSEAAGPEVTAQDGIWMQHTKPLARILREIQPQKPNALFFDGDTIMGGTTNAAVLDRQYAYWRGMISALLESGTYVVPVAGNHEVQVALGETNASGKAVKAAQRACEDAWRANMGDLILDTNLWKQLTGFGVEAWDPEFAPAVGGPDHIVSDQRQLSYSFDCRGIHFAMINTDAVGNDSHAPVAWLAEDFARAKKRGAQHFFIFGHKMAFTYNYGEKTKTGGLDAFPENGDAFWKLAQDYDATYFTSHEHIYHSMQPRNSGAHHPWQIICGAAGAPFDAKPGESKNPNDRKYAWVLVKVYASGRVHMDAFGFDEHYGPTELIESIELAPGDSHLTEAASSGAGSPH